MYSRRLTLFFHLIKFEVEGKRQFRETSLPIQTAPKMIPPVTAEVTGLQK